VLNPQTKIPLLTTYDEKIKLIEKLDVNVLIEEPFSREFSSLTAKQFFTDVLIKKLNVNSIIVGYDFGFGNNRKGSLDTLIELCNLNGVEIKVEPPLRVDGLTISSTEIRNRILEGDMECVTKCLGRHFSYQGVVVKGEGRGRKLGFRTANIQSTKKILPKIGVYASKIIYRNQEFLGVTNIGRQPTFHQFDENYPITLETHILDFNQDIYGEEIEVFLVKRIRDEKKFSNVESLISQIQEDIKITKELSKAY